MMAGLVDVWKVNKSSWVARNGWILTGLGHFGHVKAVS